MSFSSKELISHERAFSTLEDVWRRPLAFAHNSKFAEQAGTNS
jgi:hypothetical protein